MNNYTEYQNKWIKFRKEIDTSKHRLFCLPYAGAGASTFIGWQDFLGNEIEICPIQLPGRENRMSEELINDCESLVENIIDAIFPILKDKPFSVFGHSMGGIIGYELVKRLEKDFKIEAKHLFISASYIPEEGNRKIISNLNDEDFIVEVEKYNGLDKELLKLKEFKKYFISILRNDFKVIESHRLRGEKKVKSPIKAYCGEEDLLADVNKVCLWEEYTDDKFDFRMFKGNHFFINDYKADICIDIVNTLK